MGVFIQYEIDEKSVLKLGIVNIYIYQNKKTFPTQLILGNN